MNSIIRAVALIALLAAAPAHALTVKYESEGPMMGGDRLGKFVGPLLGGAVVRIADIDQGGGQRLSVRVRSKYFADDQSFLYLVEIELQQRVAEADTGRVWWPSIEKWVSWGSVPSEAELRKNITDLVNSKVNVWKPQ
jgi:hypothetical protein